MKNFIKVMKALSDPNRVKILKMLQQKSMCVCELQTALKVSQPAVSKHLKLLEESDLINCKKDGLWVNYFIAEGGNNPYASSLLGNLKFWLNNEPDIEGLIEILPTIRREEVCKR